jgi:peptide chain release factor subunit 1
MGVIASPFSSERRRTAGTPTVAVASQLDRLMHVRPGEHRVVSCYVKLEPRDRSRGKYLIKLKNRVRSAAAGLERLGLDRPVREAAERDLGRVVDRLRDGANLPPTQGIAVFACEAVDLFEVIPLPLVYRSRLAVDRTPLVRELASVDEEFGRLLAVVFDRASARFFEVTAYEAVELPGLRADSTRGARFHSDRDSPGWGEHAYHNRIREEKQRHLEGIARELFLLDRRRAVQGVILASAGTDANALRPFLHTYVAERVLGTMKLSPKEVTPARLHHEALVVRETWERASERAVVAGLAERLGAGWAVNGIPPTLRALARGQVRALLVHADAALPGFRCSESGRLALTARECRGEGDPIPVLDVVDDAIEEALRQGVDVNVVYDPEACRRIEGLAGLLRFRR